MNSFLLTMHFWIERYWKILVASSLNNKMVKACPYLKASNASKIHWSTGAFLSPFDSSVYLLFPYWKVYLVFGFGLAGVFLYLLEYWKERIKWGGSRKSEFGSWRIEMKEHNLEAFLLPRSFSFVVLIQALHPSIHPEINRWKKTEVGNGWWSFWVREKEMNIEMELSVPKWKMRIFLSQSTPQVGLSSRLLANANPSCQIRPYLLLLVQE